MDLSRRLRSLQTSLRPLQRWFDSLTGKVISLVVIVIAFLILFRLLD